MTLRFSTGPHLRTEVNTRDIMLNVLASLFPACVAGVYLYGYRAALVLVVSVAAAMLSEYLWQKLTHRPVAVGDLSCAVTGLILGLNMPPEIPLWVPAIGSVIAIIIVKQLFGGLGHNFMNPAMFGRAVLLASWPVMMTGFTLPHRLFGASAAAMSQDVVSSATALPALNATGASGYGYMDLLLGNAPGCIGEACKVAILIGFVYLLLTGVITWHVPVLMVGSVFVMSWLMGMDPVASILTGGVLFAAVFMATDYVTNPMLRIGECIFAVGCGAIVVIIRKFGAYPEGVTYAILLMNIATPLIDRFTRRRIYGEVKQHG